MDVVQIHPLDPDHITYAASLPDRVGFTCVGKRKSFAGGLD